MLFSIFHFLSFLSRCRINFDDPATTRPGSLAKSAVLAALEEEENAKPGESKLQTNLLPRFFYLPLSNIELSLFYIVYSQARERMKKRLWLMLLQPAPTRFFLYCRCMKNYFKKWFTLSSNIYSNSIEWITAVYNVMHAFALVFARITSMLILCFIELSIFYFITSSL